MMKELQISRSSDGSEEINARVYYVYFKIIFLLFKNSISK